jgi:hypothetical protein
MRFPEMLGPKPIQPIRTRPFTHIARITAAHKIRSSCLPTFRLGTYVIESARSSQRLSTIGTFIPPKVKDMLPKSCLRLAFTKEFRAVDVVFHAGTAL